MNDRAGRGFPEDPDWPDDETARRLREVLANEARSIQPAGDGLGQIRHKIQAQRHARRAWLRPIAVAAAALATAAVAVIAVVVIKPSAHHGDGQLPAGTASSPIQHPTPSAVVSPSPTATPHDVTVYYVGKLKDPQQLLYTETVSRPWPEGNAFVKDAINAMLSTPPTDPDYKSYWPTATTVLGVSIQNGTQAVVDLSPEAATGPQGLGAISTQQLFYTIQGAAPKIQSMELRIGGKPVSSLWGSPLTEPISPLPNWQVFAHVWITSPANGATVARAVTFGGDAIVNEANVNWEVLMNGAVLTQGHTTASAGAPEQGTWQASVTLTPGTYTIRAFEVSMKDGSRTYVDDKVITVN